MSQRASARARAVPPSEVVVVGNVGVDTNVFVAGELDLASEGHFSRNLDYVGQAGAYSSRGFARLGRRTAFLGHVGDDPLGAWVRATLSGDGIDLRGLGTDPAGTARSINLMGRDGARVNFYDGKGHQQVRIDAAVAEAVFAGTRLAVFHLPDWARHLLPVAHDAGAVIACDLQDVRDPDDPYRADFVAGADIVFVSAAHHPEPDAMLSTLQRRCRGGLVVCGLGALGVAVADSGGVRRFAAPLLDLPLLDTNGAGDALAVGFLTAYVLQGRSIEEAVLRGQLGARWNCAQVATSSDLVTADRLEALASGLDAAIVVGMAGMSDSRTSR